jgi:predicted enzyme related to lactoylglutathione lyase
MSKFEGRFVWYELITTDPEAAKAFYGAVVGWRMQDQPMPGMTYTLLHAGDAQVAGLMAIPPEGKAMGASPNWTGYVATADVDAKAKQGTDLGGKVLREPSDIPGVGRFAIVADPHGAVVALFRGDGDGPMDPGPGAPGHVGWHELYAGDLEADFAFYSTMFGWQKRQAMDMGPMGTYQLFGVGDVEMGGMMTKPDPMPTPAWLYYFNVGDIDEAAERVKSAGGQVQNGPMEVPGGWIIQAQDPQGAMFALFGTRSA